MGVCRRPPWREQSISAPAMVGSTTKYRSGLWIVLSLTSCILSVSLAKSEARYRGYSGYRRNYNPGYFRGYRSSYGRSDYQHQVQQHHQHSGPRKYGYKIVAPSVSHIEAEQDRFIPAPVKPSIVSPSFNIDIDLASEQQVPAVPSNKIDIEENNPPPPPPPFPARIQKPQPITNPISIPAPIPAVPPPAVIPQPSAVPAVVRADLPLLPQAIPAVPGRPILSESSQSESAGNIFVPMPVPAVPGL